MLRAAHQDGIKDALERFGLAPKTATLADWVGGARKMLIGQPGRAFIEGPKAFSPGGLLSHENTWWPSTQGLHGMQKAMPWVQRAGTMAIPLQMATSAHRDPNEGGLSNALGTAGQIAGMAYGFPAGGIIGGPMLGELGRNVGKGVGHLLGSHPKDPQQP